MHLAWNFDLKNDELPTGYKMGPITLSPSEQKFIAALCNKIAMNSEQIPYGLSDEGVSFEAVDGRLRLAATGKGLTCATFVLSIFEVYGYVLLKRDEWPEDANLEWQSAILELLEKSGAPEKQLNAVRDDLGCRRYTPLEVVGAAGQSGWPIGFSEALRLAEQLEMELN